MIYKDSELILNPDGSVYHLNLKPEHIADTIIFVGDPDRVEKVTQHFNTIEFTIQKREFKTQTGTYNNNRITVISTGIGADNIDIVLNELDALVNVDLKTKTPKKSLKQLDIIRIGTSGALQKNIPLDSFLMSSFAFDFSGMLLSYNIAPFTNPVPEKAFIKHTNWFSEKAKPILIEMDNTLAERFLSSKINLGVTATANGFYGPQGRKIRLSLQDSELNHKIDSFKFNDLCITNLEMETAAIYGLAKLLGHKAISLNAIIANRAKGTFSKDPNETIENLITYTLDRI